MSEAVNARAYLLMSIVGPSGAGTRITLVGDAMRVEGCRGREGGGAPKGEPRDSGVRFLEVLHSTQSLYTDDSLDT